MNCIHCKKDPAGSPCIDLLAALDSLCEIRRWMKELNVKSFDKYHTALHERFDMAEQAIKHLDADPLIEAVVSKLDAKIRVAEEERNENIQLYLSCKLSQKELADAHTIFEATIKSLTELKEGLLSL